MPNLEEAIRERAYHLWIADGQPEGKADIYWLNAQHEILTTSVESLASTAAAADTVATKPAKGQRSRGQGKPKLPLPSCPCERRRAGPGDDCERTGSSTSRCRQPCPANFQLTMAAEAHRSPSMSPWPRPNSARARKIDRESSRLPIPGGDRDIRKSQIDIKA